MPGNFPNRVDKKLRYEASGIFYTANGRRIRPIRVYLPGDLFQFFCVTFDVQPPPEKKGIREFTATSPAGGESCVVLLHFHVSLEKRGNLGNDRHETVSDVHFRKE